MKFIFVVSCRPTESKEPGAYTNIQTQFVAFCRIHLAHCTPGHIFSVVSWVHRVFWVSHRTASPRRPIWDRSSSNRDRCAQGAQPHQALRLLAPRGPLCTLLEWVHTSLTTHWRHTAPPAWCICLCLSLASSKRTTRGWLALRLCRAGWTSPCCSMGFCATVVLTWMLASETFSLLELLDGTCWPPLKSINGGDWDLGDQEGPEDLWKDTLLVYPCFEHPRQAWLVHSRQPCF